MNRDIKESKKQIELKSKELISQLKAQLLSALRRIQYLIEEKERLTKEKKKCYLYTSKIELKVIEERQEIRELLREIENLKRREKENIEKKVRVPKLKIRGKRLERISKSNSSRNIYNSIPLPASSRRCSAQTDRGIATGVTTSGCSIMSVGGETPNMPCQSAQEHHYPLTERKDIGNEKGSNMISSGTEVKDWHVGKGGKENDIQNIIIHRKKMEATLKLLDAQLEIEQGESQHMGSNISLDKGENIILHTGNIIHDESLLRGEEKCTHLDLEHIEEEVY